MTGERLVETLLLDMDRIKFRFLHNFLTCGDEF